MLRLVVSTNTTLPPLKPKGLSLVPPLALSEHGYGAYMLVCTFVFYRVLTS